MIHYNLYLTENQVFLLKSLQNNGITVAEHIRRAIDEYLKNRKDDNFDFSISSSTNLKPKGK